jgi:large subunit ribosomal protein L4
MIEVPVLDMTGKSQGTIPVDEAKLGGKVHRRLLRDVVVMYEANQRVGTASVKTRREREGSGKKPYRQKGTGLARAGSLRSPIWRGGGRIHGPKPRDYSYQMPRAAKRLALQSAVLAKMQDGEVSVVDKLELAEAKTKQVATALKNMGIHETCLLVLPKPDANVWRSARNLPLVNVSTLSDLNAYDVLLPKKVLFTKDALSQFLGVPS